MPKPDCISGRRRTGLEPTHDHTGGRPTFLKLAPARPAGSAIVRQAGKYRASARALVYRSSPSCTRVGVRVGVIPFSSQACSGCGVLSFNKLPARWHICPACGTSLLGCIATSPLPATLCAWVKSSVASGRPSRHQHSGVSQVEPANLPALAGECQDFMTPVLCPTCGVRLWFHRTQEAPHHRRV